MSMLKTMKSRLAAMTADAEIIYAEVEAKGEKATADERIKLQNVLKAGAELAEQVKQAEALVQPEVKAEAPATSAAPEVKAKTLGQAFTDSKEFKGRNGSKEVRVEFKANEIVGVTGVASTQAFPVFSQRLSEVFGVARNNLAILSAFSSGTTNSNAIDYLQQVTRTNNAAETEELSSKPQSVLDWDLVTASVRTIAHYVVATEQVLDDEPRLQGLITDDLSVGVQERLQTQLITGNGTAPNLRGILNTSGTNNRVHAVSGARFVATDTRGDTIRKMLTDVRLAFGTPNLIILNPADAETIEIQREGAGSGTYLRVYDPALGTIWRVPVLEHSVMTAGTAVAGDFARGAKYYVRQDVTVATGWINDQFIKNAFTLRAEMRAAFTVPYPAFFSKATGL